MHEPDAMSTRVVPVSVMPAVWARIGVPAAPYVMVWSMPTNSFAGAVEVMGLECRVQGSEQRGLQNGTQAYTKWTSPVSLLGSTPPNVSSPLVAVSSLLGSNEIPT